MKRIGKGKRDAKCQQHCVPDKNEEWDSVLEVLSRCVFAWRDGETGRNNTRAQQVLLRLVRPKKLPRLRLCAPLSACVPASLLASCIPSNLDNSADSLSTSPSSSHPPWPPSRTSRLFKMSERKVLTKYYPPEFDPSKIARTPKHLRPTGPKTIPVRLMAPFSMKCTSCGEYIYKGRKFNARKETTDEKYLTITIYRFYIRCTRCSSEITFKTDPKNMDYTCERGAKRNFESWRDPASTELKETDEERLDRLEREEADEADNAERNAMEELEQKMEESKREMQVADALDEIMQRNARIERGEKGGKEEEALAQVRDFAKEQREAQERADAEAARKAFESANVQRVKREEESQINGHQPQPIPNITERSMQPPPSFERAKKIKKPLVPGLLRKSEPSPLSLPASIPPKPAGLGLGDYDSDDD